MGYVGKKIYRGGKNGDKEEEKKKGRGRTKRYPTHP
jgi:hypothetical protein